MKCLKCDSCVENKQKGLMCFNPNSDYFNERLKDIEIDECKYFTDICYVNPKDEDEKGLFDEVLH